MRVEATAVIELAKKVYQRAIGEEGHVRKEEGKKYGIKRRELL